MPNQTDDTSTRPDRTDELQLKPPEPALLVASAPKGMALEDKHAIEGELLVGRSKDNGLRLLDVEVSRKHLRVFRDGERFRLEDLGSHNGTYLNGKRLAEPVELGDQDLIRLGRVLLVFHPDARMLEPSPGAEHHGFTGRFHAAALWHELVSARQSGRDLLLAGPRGCGEETAARALAAMFHKPLEVHRAARFSFANEETRAGMIERADGGVLYLDEAEDLSRDAQQSLVRVIDDKRIQRAGEDEEREVDVRFVLASNEPTSKHGLTKDLLERLHVAELPPLSARRADIPEIFDHLLRQELARVGAEGFRPRDLMSEIHYEALILDGFGDDNLRGLTEVAGRIGATIKDGADPRKAAADVFSRRYGVWHTPSDEQLLDDASFGRVTLDVPRPEGPKELSRVLIRDAFETVGGDVADIERELEKRGVGFTRESIARILDELGLKGVKKG